MTEEEQQKLLEENLAITKEIQALVQKTATYIKWLRIMDFVKLAIILIPLIAAWVYLPQIIQTFTSGYSEIIPSDLLR